MKSPIQEIEKSFDEKITKTAADGGFLADVGEDYEPVDFDVDLIKSFLSSSIIKVLDTLKEEVEKNPLVYGETFDTILQLIEQIKK